MSQSDNDQWSFGEELYELRSWDLKLSKLDPKWQSAASEMLNYRKKSKAAPADHFQEKSKS